MRSRRSGFAATDASSRSTATRIASTRCGATTNRRSLPSSTGRTLERCADCRRARVRGGARGGRDSGGRPARASRQHAKQRGRLSYRPSIRGAAAARPSSTVPARSNGWVAFSRGFTRPARNDPSRNGRRSISPASEMRLAPGCSSTATCLPTCAMSMRASAHALDGVRRAFDRAGDITSLRLHGDCHAGNVLWTDAGPHFVDFDDARMGPAVQDLWMLMSGDAAAMTQQWKNC